MLNNYEIILGSASEGRKEIFKKLFGKFKIITPDIDENKTSEELKEYKNNPIMLSMYLSYQKNIAIQSKFINPDKHIIFTFDTIVVHQGEIKQKPENKNIARKWLYSYINDIQEIITSYTIYISDINLFITDFDISRVYFKEIPTEEIEKYINENPVEKWSGGIAIEKARKFFEILEGNVDSIIGVPSDKIISTLKRLIS